MLARLSLAEIVSNIHRRIGFRGDPLGDHGKFQDRYSTSTITVEYPDLTIMIFHDFPDDSESETGPLLSGGHVRFGQSMPINDRQATAIIANHDQGVILVHRYADLYCTGGRIILLPARLYRIGGVLQ